LFKKKNNQVSSILKEVNKSEFKRKENEILDLISKFSFEDLRKFALEYLGYLLDDEIEGDAERIEFRRTVGRDDYIDWIGLKLKEGEIGINQIKGFANDNNVTFNDFFEDRNESKLEFENFLEIVRSKFKPEETRDSKELLSQVIVFLATKFPHHKLERMVRIENIGTIGVLVDDKYVIHCLIPQTEDELRLLGYNIMELKEKYPMQLVVLVKNENIDNVNLDKFIEKTRTSCNVPTLVCD
jgi:hypothetical protein